MKDRFSIESTINKLWDKLDGWLDAIILKLPNFVLALIVIVLFYFIAKGVRNVLQKLLLSRIAQKSIQDIIAKIVFIIIFLIGFFIALGVLDLNSR